MKNLYIFQIFKSNYCRIVFLFSLAVMALLTPKKIFFGYYNILGFLFVLVSSILVTCLVRSAKEKIMVARAKKLSIVGIISLLVGIIAMDVCSVGAPICGASIATGVVAILFPGIGLSFLNKYSVIIIVISLLMQVGALYFMHCFKKVGNLTKTEDLPQ